MSLPPRPGARGEARPGLVYVKRDDGHRRSYQALLSRLLDLAEAQGPLRPRLLLRLLLAPRLLVSTIDDDYAGFIALALGRAALGRRTAGLFLRPEPCFRVTRPAHLIKRWAFVLLRRVPGVSVLTILPFALRPEYARVARDWVHDPQTWDLGERPGPPPRMALMERARAAAAGRPILCVLGVVTPIKGVGFLADILESRLALAGELLVVLAGAVAPESRAEAERLSLSGALIEDRTILDAELESLHHAADLVWSCYRPDYDQASGIFGRALQTGGLPVVRAGSLIEAYAGLLGAAALALPYGEPAAAAGLLSSAARAAPRRGRGPEAGAAVRRDDTLRKLRAAL